MTDELRHWLTAQRWYASKSQEISDTVVLDQLELDGQGQVQLLGLTFTTGTHAIYQLVPDLAAGVGEMIAAGGEHSTAQGRFAFRSDDALELRSPPQLRPIGAEQSNTTVVLDDAYALKVFRRLEGGISPELEMLRFLSARGFAHIAPLRGWYEYEGPALSCTLGVLQDLIPDARDGWELALEEIPSEPERFLDRIASLGAAIAHMHSTLATDAEDPAFAPDEPSAESMALLRARIDDEIEQVFVNLPDSEAVAPIAQRGADVRERLAGRPVFSSAGRFIRIHGDLHLGQTLLRPDGSWVILDFEGEPARSHSQRRMKRSGLRDVAAMLRSFAYAAAAVQRAGGPAAGDVEARARDAFLEAYLGEVNSSLLPPSEAAVRELLGIFELEKAIYELGYELDNRPDWVSIPVAGIERLLEAA